MYCGMLTVQNAHRQLAFTCPVQLHFQRRMLHQENKRGFNSDFLLHITLFILKHTWYMVKEASERVEELEYIQKFLSNAGQLAQSVQYPRET